MRQMQFEGGFQGRTNKLVDGCYSWWQGGLFALLHSALLEEKIAHADEAFLFSRGIFVLATLWTRI